MSAPNRQAIITSCHKVLKKYYKPVGSDNRPLLDQMAYAAVLENSPREMADRCFAELTKRYFDWNEIRVSSVKELCEVMTKLPNAEESAKNLKNLLQSVFETLYSFELDGLKKLNLGKAIKQLEKFRGGTPFIIAYATQHGLGGHSIPVDQSLLHLMQVLGVINEAEARKKTIPGMERAIPKSKGIEFASLVHELAVDFNSSPFSKKYRDIILEIAPDAKSRFPKRASSKSKEEADAAIEKPTKKTTKKKAVTAKAPEKATVEKKTPKKKKAEPAIKKKATTKKSPVKKSPAKKTVKKKAVPTKKKAAPKKGAKKSSRITKRKPK